MPFPECHMRGIKQWLAFCSWLLSFPTQCLGVIRVVTCIRICSCWSLSNIPCVNDHNLFMADGYLGCFQLLVVMIEYSYKILCEHKVSFPLHKYLRVWLLGQIVSLYLNSQQTAKLELIFGEWTVFLCLWPCDSQFYKDYFVLLVGELQLSMLSLPRIFAF